MELREWVAAEQKPEKICIVYCTKVGKLLWKDIERMWTIGRIGSRVARRPNVLFFSSKTSSLQQSVKRNYGMSIFMVGGLMIGGAAMFYNEVENESSAFGDKYSIYEKCELKLFTGNAHPQLAQNMAKCLDIPLNQATVSKFKNGESRVEILNSVRDCDVYVVQPTCMGG